jgi:GDP-L-fucose synthase
MGWTPPHQNGINYYLNNFHVLPALIHKIPEAKQVNASEVMTIACVFLLEQPTDKLAEMFNDEQPSLINLGCDEDSTIRELTSVIASVVGYTCKFIQDTTKPDGTMRKVLNASRIQSLGMKAETSLKVGIAFTYKQFYKTTP